MTQRIHNMTAAEFLTAADYFNHSTIPDLIEHLIHKKKLTSPSLNILQNFNMKQIEGRHHTTVNFDSTANRHKLQTASDLLNHLIIEQNSNLHTLHALNIKQIETHFFKDRQIETTLFWLLSKTKLDVYTEWHNTWRETHPQAVSAFTKYIKKYAEEPNWEQMKFFDFHDFERFQRYLSALHAISPQPDKALLIKILKNEKEIIEQIKLDNQNVIEDMREEYWHILVKHLENRWFDSFCAKNDQHKKSSSSELKRSELNKKHINTYANRRIQFSSRNILDEHWKANQWKNEFFDFCALSDANFSNTQNQEFDKKYFSRDFIIISPCHPIVCHPYEAIEAILKTEITDIPDLQQVLNTDNSVAVTCINGRNTLEMYRLLESMRDEISHLVVTGYLTKQNDDTISHGFMPAFILIRNEENDVPITSEDFFKRGKAFAKQFSQACYFSHAASEKCCTMHTPNGSLPTPFKNIADTLDYFYQMNLHVLADQGRIKLSSVRYLSRQSADEFTQNRRIGRGELFWPEQE